MLPGPQWKINTQERRSALFVASTHAGSCVKETIDHVVEGASNTSEGEAKTLNTGDLGDKVGSTLSAIHREPNPPIR